MIHLHRPNNYSAAAVAAAAAAAACIIIITIQVLIHVPLRGVRIMGYSYLQYMVNAGL